MSVTAVGISGSPSARSRSRGLLTHALSRLAVEGFDSTLIDLADLPADALLGRTPSAEVKTALDLVANASIVVASTPVYRATYSGLLKVFFDLLPQRALVGKIGIAIATGGASGHLLVLDHGLRPLFASVGAVTVPTGIFATDAELDDAPQRAKVFDRIARAVIEAAALTEGQRVPVGATPFTVEGAAHA
jgi:FMN reductase